MTNGAGHAISSSDAISTSVPSDWTRLNTANKSAPLKEVLLSEILLFIWNMVVFSSDRGICFKFLLMFHVNSTTKSNDFLKHFHRPPFLWKLISQTSIMFKNSILEHSWFVYSLWDNALKYVLTLFQIICGFQGPSDHRRDAYYLKNMFFCKYIHYMFIIKTLFSFDSFLQPPNISDVLKHYFAEICTSGNTKLYQQCF